LALPSLQATDAAAQQRTSPDLHLAGSGLTAQEPLLGGLLGGGALPPLADPLGDELGLDGDDEAMQAVQSLVRKMRAREAQGTAAKQAALLQETATRLHAAADTLIKEVAKEAKEASAASSASLSKARMRAVRSLSARAACCLTERA
jgi:hypothetical protein